MIQQQRQDTATPLDELGIDAEELERIARIDFSVDRDGELPLGLQLGWKLRSMIAGGVLRPGDRLPSVRELADFSSVNVNTARAVYRKLEELGAITSEHGRGTFVADDAASTPDVEAIASEALKRARGAGIDPQEVAVAIYAVAARDEAADALPSLEPSETEEGERGIRRALRVQIARLEAELGEHAWDHRRTSAEGRRRSPEPAHVASVEELERTRDALIERLAEVRATAERRGSREHRAQARVEAMIRDPGGHRWEIVTSEEIGDTDCRHWHVVPRFGPLGAIMGWWRVKVSSGCPLAAPREAAVQ